MSFHRHQLGVTSVKAGEIITFNYTEGAPKTIVVVALHDIDLSKEMALFTETVDRRSRAIFTENALPAFIEYLTEKRLLHVGEQVAVDFGRVGRPATRLLDEYRFRINPESFWEDKLIHRYENNSFTLYNHQNHLLTIMMGVEAPFSAVTQFIDSKGEFLGILRFSVLSDNKYTLLDADDIERIRLAIQSDISLFVGELNILAESVVIESNPAYGINPFKLTHGFEYEHGKRFAVSESIA